MATALKDIIYLIVVGGGIVVGVISNYFYQLSLLERILLGLGSSFLILAIFTGVAYLVMRGRKPKIEFYSNRSERNGKRGDLERELNPSQVKHVWISAWVATTFVHLDILNKYKGKITKLLLQNPDAEYLTLVSRILDENNETYCNNIVANTKAALLCGIDVWWTLEPMTGIVIANPEKDDGVGWIRVDNSLPWTKADGYPSYVVYEDTQREFYSRIKRAFLDSVGEHDDTHKTDMDNGGKLVHVTQEWLDEWLTKRGR
jgi:hypothetical protein